MIAKKQPRPADVPPDLHLTQTRKVDSMSELAADMLLADADATLPPPPANPSPASFSAVHYTGPRQHEARPLALDLDEPAPQFRSRYGRALVVALLLVLGAALVLAAVLLRAA
ncbi:MAG: hypothetical protein JWP97_1505 [Labilithrix sp.]|nr:hypothetical protein [Labilithrix sp.]